MSAAIVEASNDSRVGVPWDGVFRICLEDLVDIVIRVPPPIRLPEPPPPPPLVLGCDLPGCGLQSSEQRLLTLRVTLTGDLIKEVALDFKRPASDITVVSPPPGETSKPDQYSFRIGRGTKTIEGLGAEPLVAIPRLTWDKTALEGLLQQTTAHRRGDAEKIVTFAVEQLIGEIVVAEYQIRLILTFCGVPGQGQPVNPGPDLVRINNRGAGAGSEAVALLFGRPDPTSPIQPCRNDILYGVPPGAGQIAVASMLSSGPCNSEVAIFSYMQAMKLQPPTPPAWQDQLGEIVDVALDSNPVNVPVSIWVLSSEANANTKARQDVDNNANLVYAQTLCGIQFQISHMHPNNELRDGEQLKDKAARFGLSDAVCESPDLDIFNLKNNIGYDPGILNVYYVDWPRDYARGWRCSGDDGDVILIGTSIADNQTLAHELGHALSLGHTNQQQYAGDLLLTSVSEDHNLDGQPDFDALNIMWGGGTGRTRLTKGQCFRCNVHNGSWTTYGIAPANPGRSCPESAYLDMNCPWVGLDR